MNTSHPLRLLSLDGGGIRGVSELFIIQEIMQRIQTAQKLPSEPIPADFFDLICGTSTGGLIALLLGRLRLTATDAIKKYAELSEQVFSEKKSFGDGTFKSSNLEKAIKKVVKEKLGNENEKMFTTAEECKTFVCAVEARNVGKPRLFRTYLAAKNRGYDCEIWEAGRATSAAPTFFKRMIIEDAGIKEEFIDAGLGCNNPVRQLIEEARREFGPARDVGCIVSIGTGKPRVAGFEAPGFFQRKLPLALINVLKSISTDSESEASAMKDRYQNCPGLYHRLNVERGLEEVTLEEWMRLGEVKAHTMAYLESTDISNDIDTIVGALVGRPVETFPLGHLDGIVSSSEDSPPCHFLYPSHEVNHFVPRASPERQIRKHFQLPSIAATPTVVILLGMGGCGKSQLALEYCQHSESEKSYSSIFWIDAMSPSTVGQSFNTVATKLSKPQFDPADVNGNVCYVLETISKWRRPWLLIFDNFDDPHSFASKSIKDYFPRSNKGSILITSRDGATKSLGQHIDVTTMSEDEAVELLFRRSETTRSEANDTEALRIAKTLGFHALAIDQAGAYISARQLVFHLFLEDYTDRMKIVLGETPTLWDYKRKLEPDQETETKLSVYTTWELSFALITGDKLSRDDKGHLLTLLAFFDGSQISDILFPPFACEERSWMISCRIDGDWDKHKFRDILSELRNLSLIQNLSIQSSGAVISLHPLVQEWIKLRISTELRQTYTIEAADILSWFVKKKVFHEMTFDTRQTTISHIETIIQNDQQYSDQETPTKAMLTSLEWFARFYNSLGRYQASEALRRRQFEGTKVLLGEEHPDTLKIMGNLADTLFSQGKFDDAEPMFRKIIDMTKHIFGEEDDDTLTAMNNLAVLLSEVGNFKEAEPLLRQIIASREKIFRKEHPDTLASMHNFASILTKQGKYSDAEILYRETLDLRMKVSGKEHPSTLAAMNGLAGLLREQDKYGEAEAILRKLLLISERVLGPEHPKTLLYTSHFGSLLVGQGRYEEAEAIFQALLPLLEKFVGMEHPDTLTSMHNLAATFRKQGKYSDAVILYRETLDLKMKVWGKEHPSTLETINGLAGVLRDQGKYDEAEAIRRQLLLTSERVLGSEHPITLMYTSNFGKLLLDQGRYEEAEATFQALLPLCENFMGMDHEDTNDCRERLQGCTDMLRSPAGSGDRLRRQRIRRGR